jgi:hypothetical protein
MEPSWFGVLLGWVIYSEHKIWQLPESYDGAGS